jgi:hypothetical protein
MSICSVVVALAMAALALQLQLPASSAAPLIGRSSSSTASGTRASSSGSRTNASSVASSAAASWPTFGGSTSHTRYAATDAVRGCTAPDAPRTIEFSSSDGSPSHNFYNSAPVTDAAGNVYIVQGMINYDDGVYCSLYKIDLATLTNTSVTLDKSQFKYCIAVTVDDANGVVFVQAAYNRPTAGNQGVVSNGIAAFDIATLAPRWYWRNGDFQQANSPIRDHFVPVNSVGGPLVVGGTVFLVSANRGYEHANPAPHACFLTAFDVHTGLMLADNGDKKGGPRACGGATRGPTDGKHAAGSATIHWGFWTADSDAIAAQTYTPPPAVPQADTNGDPKKNCDGPKKTSVACPGQLAPLWQSNVTTNTHDLGSAVLPTYLSELGLTLLTTTFSSDSGSQTQFRVAGVKAGGKSAFPEMTLNLAGKLPVGVPFDGKHFFLAHLKTTKSNISVTAFDADGSPHRHYVTREKKSTGVAVTSFQVQSMLVTRKLLVVALGAYSGPAVVYVFDKDLGSVLQTFPLREGYTRPQLIFSHDQLIVQCSDGGPILDLYTFA